ncbi:hypothetical protein DPSP01_000625 [Paraphaeosphaeria sporulosa]
MPHSAHMITFALHTPPTSRVGMHGCRQSQHAPAPQIPTLFFLTPRSCITLSIHRRTSPPPWQAQRPAHSASSHPIMLRTEASPGVTLFAPSFDTARAVIIPAAYGEHATIGSGGAAENSSVCADHERCTQNDTVTCFRVVISTSSARDHEIGFFSEASEQIFAPNCRSTCSLFFRRASEIRDWHRPAAI